MASIDSSARGTLAQPDFTDLSGAIATAQLGGTVSGDLTGTLPSPTVSKINGYSVTNSPSTSGDVLTYQSGSDLAWQQPAPASEWEVLYSPSTTTGASSVTLISGTGGVADWSSYSDLLVKLQITNNSAGCYVSMQMGSGSIDTGNNYSYVSIGRDSGGTTQTANQNSIAHMDLSIGTTITLSTASSKMHNFESTIYSVNDSSVTKMVSTGMCYIKSPSYLVTGNCAGEYFVATAIDQVMISLSSGTADMTVAVYGRK